MLNHSENMRCDARQTSTCFTADEVTYPGKIRVLIFYGDSFIAAGLEAVLKKRRDFKILIPRRGSEVARVCEASAEADVVIADYELGLRLSEAGRESGRRVVILTYSDSEAQICRALECGVRGYLLLGCSPEELVEGIRSVHEGGVTLAARVVARLAENLKQEALTARQEGVLRQVMLGLSNKEIAIKFGLTEGTVKTHVKAIFAKLNATSRTEAIAIAHRRGLLPYETERRRQQRRKLIAAPAGGP